MKARAVVTLALLVLGSCKARSVDLPQRPRVKDAGPMTDVAVINIGQPDAVAGDRAPAEDLPTSSDGPGPVIDLPAPSDACAADLDRDPRNCGGCGRICSFANAAPACAAGVCQLAGCLPGFHDLDRQPENGCEYACTVTGSTDELCDGRDNDCDGQTDEGTDLMRDAENCGSCGRRCGFLNADATCAAGVCQLGACRAGFVDANRVDADGCECARSNDGVEVCDGIDNDCNGKLDDVPDRNFENDAQNCGGCRNNCTALPNAVATCMSNACVISACSIGWANQDGDVRNGCEVACPGGGGGPEVCDGVDNDCDGKTDTADPDLVPAPTGLCASLGECAGTQPRCTAGRWLCDYGPGVQVVSPNQIIGNESWCDGKDNDCDGCIDETFPLVGRRPTAVGGTCTETTPTACADTGKGACQGRGSFTCTPDKTSTSCTITTPGAAPSDELCDGRDNNCDGIVDNASPTDPARIKEPMVAVSGGGLTGTVYVYAYEASRPDATAAGQGTSTARACARPGVMPWTNVSYPEAAAACQAAGKRLCSEAEWQRACETAAATACSWSFADACTGPSTACNTSEHDGVPGAGDDDVALATGARPMCYARWSDSDRIFDLSGNVKEWTTARATGVNPVRGGAYDTVIEGATCGFRFAVFDDRFRFANTGFRCCADAP